jgi:hypothetical protein
VASQSANIYVTVSIAVNAFATGSVTVGGEIDSGIDGGEMGSGIDGEVYEVNDDPHPLDYAAVTSLKQYVQGASRFVDVECENVSAANANVNANANACGRLESS